MLILFFLLLSCISCLLGIVEGILYSLKGAEAFKGNEHSYLLTLRLFIFLSLIASKFFVSDFEFVFGLSSAILAFSFFHDGFYYCTRRAIDVPHYRFNSNSDTSSARFEVKWKYRLVLFICSQITLLIYFFL